MFNLFCFILNNNCYVLSRDVHKPLVWPFMPVCLETKQVFDVSKSHFLQQAPSWKQWPDFPAWPLPGTAAEWMPIKGGGPLKHLCVPIPSPSISRKLKR